MALKNEKETAVPFNPARPLKGEKMKTLSLVFTVLAWIAAGIAVWAIWPLLVKLYALAQHLHNLWC